MYYNTKGIVLKNFNYSDSSIISKIYTQSFGIQSYIIKGIKNKNSKIRVNQLQPLSIIEMVVTKNEKNNLNTIKELSKNIYNSYINFNPIKTAISIFISEIIYKTIIEEEENIALFNFLSNTIEYINSEKELSANFHLYFLLNYSRFLGINPLNNYSIKNTSFNIKEGEFSANILDSSPTFETKHSNILNNLIQTKINDLNNLKIENADKIIILKTLINHISFHLDKNIDILSIDVLSEYFQ